MEQRKSVAKRIQALRSDLDVERTEAIGELGWIVELDAVEAEFLGWLDVFELVVDEYRPSGLMA